MRHETIVVISAWIVVEAMQLLGSNANPHPPNYKSATTQYDTALVSLLLLLSLNLYVVVARFNDKSSWMIRAVLALDAMSMVLRCGMVLLRQHDGDDSLSSFAYYAMWLLLFGWQLWAVSNHHHHHRSSSHKVGSGHTTINNNTPREKTTVVTIQPTAQDVLCGRYPHHSEMPSQNQWLQRLCASHRPEYLRSSRARRTELTRWLVGQVNGRFLRYNARSDEWQVMSPDQAREKVVCLLREGN